MLKLPFGHTNPVGVVAPNGQYDPGGAVQTPLQTDVETPLLSPYRPIGQGLQATVSLPSEYWPGGQRAPNAAVAPAPQKLPGTAAQTPEHAAVNRAVVFPKVPIGHGTQAPPLEYLPTAQPVPVDDVPPGVSHPLPLAATHGPEHSDVVSPVALPKRSGGHRVQDVAPPTLNCPAAQYPEHTDDAKPMTLPNVPAGHGAQG